MFSFKTALASLLAICFALAAADTGEWWNRQWRLRTTVASSVPARDGPDVELSAGEHQLTLGAEAGAQFDALLVLPQTDVMDRAAMNLFQNWNFAPWENPFQPGLLRLIPTAL